MRNFPFSVTRWRKVCSGVMAGVIFIIAFSLPVHVPAKDTDNNGHADTGIINNQIRTALNLRDPDSAISMYRKTLQQSIEVGYPDGAFNSLMQMSILYREKDDYRQTQAILEQALGWARKAARKDALAWCYNNMGDLHISQGDYTKAADYFYKGLDAMKKVPGPSITEANLTINLGYLYKLMDQPRKALNFYTDAERICIAGHYDYQLTGVYINKGAYYLDTHQPDSAKWYFRQVMALAKKQNLTDLIAMGNSGMGSSFMAAGEYAKAVVYLQTAIDSAKRYYPEIARDASYILGEALTHLHRYKEAEAVLIAALNETKSVNTRYNYIESYTKLIKLYKASGQYEKAMNYADTVAALKDSMMSAENAKAIGLMEVKYKSAEKDKKLAQNELLIAKQKNKLAQKNMLVASIVSALILLVLVFWLRHRNVQHKQHLQAEKIKILESENTISILKGVVQGEENERGRLARELHDGIGGMLSATMMRFMTMRHADETVVNISAYQEGMTMLEDIGDEIRKTAHNLLPPALLRQSLPDAVRAYCNSIQEGSNLQVDLQCYGEFEQVSQDFKLNIYRITQELLRNIVAHAHATEALVQLVVNGHILALTVEDNGIGFSKDQSTTGMGVHNLQTRVAALNGHCAIESEPGKGTSVFIEFDLATLPKTTTYENQGSHSG